MNPKRCGKYLLVLMALVAVLIGGTTDIAADSDDGVTWAQAQEVLDQAQARFDEVCASTDAAADDDEDSVCGDARQDLDEALSCMEKENYEDALDQAREVLSTLE